MLKTIVVPLDGSVLAVRALRFATRLARASGAELLLVHARPELNPVYFAHRESWEVAVVRERIAVHEMQSDLAALAEQLRGEGVSASVSMAVGEPARVILEAVQARQADLVAMSTHGRGCLGRWLYGSIADAVLRRVSIPVLLIPTACEGSWPEDRRLRLLIPLDGSAFAEEVLGPARELGRLLDAECLLLRVIEPTEVQAARPHPPDARGVQAALAETERYLQMMVEQLGTTDAAVRVHVEAGSPTTAIAAIARQSGPI